MSLAELYFRGKLDNAETEDDIDAILAEAEAEGWHRPSSIHLKADATRRWFQAKAEDEGPDDGA